MGHESVGRVRAEAARPFGLVRERDHAGGRRLGADVIGKAADRAGWRIGRRERWFARAEETYAVLRGYEDLVVTGLGRTLKTKCGGEVYRRAIGVR